MSCVAAGKTLQKMRKLILLSGAGPVVAAVT